MSHTAPATIANAEARTEKAVRLKNATERYLVHLAVTGLEAKEGTMRRAQRQARAAKHFVGKAKRERSYAYAH